jgi:Uma2 family endonuclease
MADTATLPPHPAAPARKRFSWADVEAMMRAGVTEEGGPEELLDGEIWVMPSEGPAHVDLKTWLDETKSCRSQNLAQRDADQIGPKRYRRRLRHDVAPQRHPCAVAGFLSVSEAMKASAVRGPDVLLLIEIADTSIQDDLTIKGPKYREYGVREYWVIDLAARVTHVHRLDGSWPEALPVAFDAELTLALAPSLRLRVADSGV